MVDGMSSSISGIANQQPPPPPPGGGQGGGQIGSDAAKQVGDIFKSFMNGDISQDDVATKLEEAGIDLSQAPIPGAPSLEDIASGEFDLAAALEEAGPPPPPPGGNTERSFPQPSGEVNQEALDLFTSVLQAYEEQTGDDLSQDAQSADLELLKTMLDDAGIGEPGSLFEFFS